MSPAIDGNVKASSEKCRTCRQAAKKTFFSITESKRNIAHHSSEIMLIRHKKRLQTSKAVDMRGFSIIHAQQMQSHRKKGKNP
ncbi:MAG: hypothetical protein V4448_13480 [Pseudomonadota bacterium]